MFSSSRGSIRSSVKPSYVPKTMSNLFEGLSKVDSLSDRFFVLNDYLEKYKEELSKVNSLKLDLPQCTLLLMDAVKTLEEEVENVWNDMKSQLNEKPTEFSPVHGRGDVIRDGESSLREKDVCNFGEERGVCRLDRGEMKDNTTEDASGIQLCKTRNRGHATLNLNRSPAVTESNSVECIKPGSLRVKTNHQQRDFQFKPILKSPSRNPRRSWTTELHNRFLEALDHLGGPEVATPRKIREAMKMDDLTNDQVKSHLQKYRLQRKRDSAADMDPSDHMEVAQDPRFSNR